MFQNTKRIILRSLLIIFFYLNTSQADVIKKFQISGNDRISNETLILFSEVKIGENINENNLNEIIKKLYETSFFEDIKVEFENNILFINVSENPLIQSLVIEGIKKKSVVENIKKIINQKEKSSFVKNKIKEDQNRILNILKANGYYFAKIDTKIKNNDNNTVDIIYNVQLGDKAVIKNIKFVGNKVFKDNKLRKVIASEEARFWKIISQKKTLDIQRIMFDEKLLKNFYRNSGYFNVIINSSYAQVIENKYFEIIFNIDAGKKYYFNNFELNLPDEYDKNDFIKLTELFDKLKLKPYSFNRIEKILDQIDEVALNKNYEFVSATYNESIVDDNKINLIINLKDTEKFYVEKVNIFGNNITSERVIRNKLLTDEGDPYNEILVNKSYNNIRGLGLFKSVETDEDTNDIKKTKVLNIKVEEKPTGEIFAGAGTGTNGSSLSFGVSENNYLGEGIKLGTNFSVTDDTIRLKFFMNEPNFKNTEKSFNRGFQRSENDFLTKYGYKTEKTGYNFGTSYEQFDDIFFSPTFSNYYEKITTNSNASSQQKKQEGNYLDFLLNYDLTLNKLNQNFNPSDGFKFKFSQELPIYSDDYTLINSIDYTNYFQTSGGAIFSVGAYLSTANSITSEDARITKRIFIPSRKLRGFEPGKIGPKDGNDYIGGNYGTSFNIASTLPGIFTEVQDLDLSFFFDAANVWGVDYSSTIDENSKIRSATGVALDWFTPIGPLSISYSLPITKNSTDVTETVRFNIGTTF